MHNRPDLFDDLMRVNCIRQVIARLQGDQFTLAKYLYVLDVREIENEDGFAIFVVIGGMDGRTVFQVIKQA